MEFYDEIAAEYDEITATAERVAQADGFVRRLRERYGARSVLDVACGTGLYALAAAGAGLRAVGADLSSAMLAQARRRAAEAKVAVDWVCCPMQELDRHVQGPFDAVLCMGNSIPHLLSDADLDAAVGGFARLAAPGGVVVIHLLNYVRILARQERIVAVTRRGDREYVRFYDFLDPLVRFNILEIRWEPVQCAHRLHSTTLRPYVWSVIQEAMARHGLRDVQAFSALAMGPWNETLDETVLLAGRKK